MWKGHEKRGKHQCSGCKIEKKKKVEHRKLGGFGEDFKEKTLKLKTKITT